MRIISSARKHGIADEDMLHAARNAIRDVEIDGSSILLIGPARDGRLLEVVLLLSDEEDDDAIIHALPLRPKFHRYLEGSDATD